MCILLIYGATRRRTTSSGPAVCILLPVSRFWADEMPRLPFFFVCVLFTDTQYIQHLSDNILYKFEKEKEKIQMTTIFF